LRTPEATPRRFDSGTNNAAKNSRPREFGNKPIGRPERNA
jgi:hypothetical protein